MIASLIVFGSAAFGAAFVLAWLFRGDLRAWLEAPKIQFQARVEQYDQATIDSPESHTP